jgi:hypothetical protein
MARALGTNAIDGDIWARFSSATYKSLPPTGTFVREYRLAKGRLVEKKPQEPLDPKTDIRIRFPAPGGGRGYYRSPTLVNLWATAPYLHNNSVGDYYTVKRDPPTRQILSKQFAPNDGTPPEDEIDVSVEGRLMMFQDGIEKLLWPEKRRNHMLRTLSDCSIFDLQPAFKDLVPAILRDWIFNFLQDKLLATAENLITAQKLPPLAATALRRKIDALIRTELKALRDKTTTEAFQALKKRLGDLVTKDLIAKAEQFVPKDVVAKAVARYEALRAEIGGEVDDLLQLKFLRIPAGTPVNLYFNLPAHAPPYALKAHIEHRNDPRALAEALLRLSDCPDLVEDRGHTFGEKLSDEEKRALIEFLKTV